MKQLALIILIQLILVNVQSQNNCTIRGQILENQSNIPIENAEIVINSNLGSSTNKKGFYEISKLNPGKYQITVKHLGFVKQSKSIELDSEKVLELNFSLEKEVQPLDEIIITDKSGQDLIISKLPYIETKVNREQIFTESARDVTDFLRLSNNIGGIRKGGTQLDPVVRGLKYSQLNVQLNNGQKIEGGCPNRMDPATAHIDVDDLESIEIFKGPYALKYGPAFGGIINMKTESHKLADTAHIHVKAMTGYESNWNGYKGHISVNGGNKYAFFNISGGRKNYGNYKDGNGNEVKSEFEKYNYTGKLGLRTFKNHLLILNFEESKGRDIRFPALPMDERSDDTQLMSADYNISSISNSIKSLKIKIYKSDVQHEMDNKNRSFSDTVVAVSNINAVNQGARGQLDMNLGKGTLSIGMDYEKITKDGDRVKNMIKQPGLPIKKEKLWNNAFINNAGIFGEYVFSKSSWEIIGAARIDFNNAKSDDIVIQHPKQGEIYRYGGDSIKSNFTNFSFSFGLTKKINSKLAISLALGRGVRSPDMTERFIILLPIGYDNFDYLGNPQLNPEANNQADLTFKISDNKVGLIQLNLFYAIINNFIAGKLLAPAQQKPLSNGVLGVKQFHNSGNAKLRGGELSYGLPQNYRFGLNLFLSYTYGTIDETTVYITNDEGEIVDSKKEKNDAMSEIPPFEIVSTFKYKFLKSKLIPKLTLRYVTDQNHVSEAQFEKTSPGFFITNFSVFYNFNKHLNVSAGVNNIFDTAFYEHLNRNIVGSSGMLYEPGRVFYINLMFNI